MTREATFRRIRTPLLSAVLTAAILAGALWIQHARRGWPFGSPDQRIMTTAVSHQEMQTEDESQPERLPIEVALPTQQSLGIRVEVLGRQALTQTVQAVATVVPDESRISRVHTRVAGWVEQLGVSTTGEMVRSGQPLARIFSQELLSSQTEYLAARRAMADAGIMSAVVESGRTRLSVLGMTLNEIETIERTGKAISLVTVTAPRSGVVMSRGVTVGTAVDPSTPLITLADLSSIWVFAEVPEASVGAVRLGTTALLDFPGSGRTPFAARVDFLYPTLTERTRTLRVRFSVTNPDGMLRPGLYGTAAFQLEVGEAITVPRDAIVDTGRQQHVFVAVEDVFEPRSVTLGVRLADRVEVLSGLEEGERIATSGVFLLDSESRLRASGGGTGHAHGESPPSEGPSLPADPHAGHRE